MRQFPRTLRGRLMLALALFALLSLGVVGVGVVLLDQQAMAEQSSRELVGLARGLAMQVDTYLTDLLSTTRAIATLPEMVRMDPPAQAALLRALFHQYPKFSRLSTFDLRGQRLASSHPGGAPMIDVRPSFIDAAQRGHQSWEVGHALSTGRPSFLIHTPIRDDDRRVVGVLGAVIDLEHLSSAVGKVQIGHGGQAFVIDPTGRVVLHPDPRIVQERRDYSQLGVPTESRLVGPGTARYILNREPRIAGYAPIREFGWTVVVDRPQADVLAAARRSWRFGLAGLAASALLAILTAIRVASRLLRPLRDLARAAEAFGAGDASAPLPLGEHDGYEIGTLVRTFANMRETVAAREDALRRMASILESTTDLVATADPDGRVLYLNRAGRKMLGLNEQDTLSGLTLSGFHPEGAHGAPLERAVETAMRDGVWSGEGVIQGLDGREIPVSQVLIAHRDQHGRCEYLSSIARDISDRKRFESELLYLATHDPLTDLPNRRRFVDQLEQFLHQSHRYQTGGAVALIDVDNFKYVNDSLGHAAGDELLQQLADLLRDLLRKSDIVARLGGDEFGIFLPFADAEAAACAGERLLTAIRSHRFHIAGQPITATASAGIALLPNHGQTVEELFTRADIALYNAKEDGRDRIAIYTSDRDWQALLGSKLSWELRIRDAIARDRFVLYCQPIIDLATGRPIQYELLIRLQGEDGQVISPKDFLHVAERFGLIQGIDRWVVRQAIQLISLMSKTEHGLVLSVNLSSRSLTDSRMRESIEQEIVRSGIDGSRLILEITETAAISHMEDARQFVHRLKQAGCRFALDDFGVGFTSFHQLKHLPIHYLKIDGSFISNLVHSDMDQELVKAMIAMAHGLGKQVIAEWVEDARTAELLKQYGADYIQGYAFGKPRPVAEEFGLTGYGASRSGPLVLTAAPLSESAPRGT